MILEFILGLFFHKNSTPIKRLDDSNVITGIYIPPLANGKPFSLGLHYIRIINGKSYEFDSPTTEIRNAFNTINNSIKK